MMKLSKIKISIILLTFLLIILLLPQNTFSEIIYQKMDQNITLNENELDVKFITEITIINTPQKSLSFIFPKTWRVTNFRAYDYNTSDLLDREINKNYSNSSINVIIDFPRSYKNETYKFISEFSRKSREESRKNEFYWSWGNANHSIELSYNIVLPGFVKIYYTNYTHDTYDIIFKKNHTIISTNGTAEPNRYFEFGFYYSNLEPPKLKMTKYIDSTKIIEDETFTVSVDVVNIGEMVAKNISIYNDNPSVFKEENEPFKNIDLLPRESKKFKYVLRGISVSENELIGETIAVYTDESGENEYKSTSNQFNVTITKEPYVIEFHGIEIPIDIVNPYPLIYNFLMGYFVLFCIYVVRKRSTEEWNSISSLDKIIYSVICSLINFIISLIMGYILLCLLILPVLYILEIPSIDPVLLFYYLFPLLFIIITSTILEKLIDKINTGEVNIIDIILRFLLRNGKWIVILYIGLILLLVFLKYILFA